jgi:putative DNA primase/helicase
MTGTLDAALGYVRRGWSVFPCQWQGDRRKSPLIERGLHAATRNEAQVRDWWHHRWPNAHIGVPTGRASGFVVLDVDVKGTVNGFDTLAEFGSAILPGTPMVHTASGGLHLYFLAPTQPEIRNTAGERGSGIGRGLDWRGEGGYVIVPSPGSGYHWDPDWKFDTAPLAPVPTALLPREPERRQAQPIEPTGGLSPYGQAALDYACCAIVAAPAGEQELTIVREAFSLGTLAGAGGIPRDFARRALQAAAGRVRDHDPRRPWRAREIEIKVNRAFDAGLDRPRRARRHG